MRARDPYLLGAVAWWGFDIAVLWACFHAFGASPPKGVIVMSYFVGMLANTLPLPGGIGGVDGGMIGAFTAFGVDVELSVVAVLAYRAFAFWLPTLPGAVAYLQLRRTVHRWGNELRASARSPGGVGSHLICAILYEVTNGSAHRERDHRGQWARRATRRRCTRLARTSSRS